MKMKMKATKHYVNISCKLELRLTLEVESTVADDPIPMLKVDFE